LYDRHRPALQRAMILYDDDCGFCKWSLAKFLAWDRRRVLEPLPLQDTRSDELLSGMSPEQRMSSWHLVTAEGEVHSAGAAFGPLLRLLPFGRPFAAISEAAPRVTERAYRLVADHRTPLGKGLRRLAGPGAIERAERRIASRAAHG
jgi:predicted DCC family thiol-disulfide oxidoreductase YuxK